MEPKILRWTADFWAEARNVNLRQESEDALETNDAADGGKFGGEHPVLKHHNSINPTVGFLLLPGISEAAASIQMGLAPVGSLPSDQASMREAQYWSLLPTDTVHYEKDVREGLHV